MNPKALIRTKAQRRRQVIWQVELQYELFNVNQNGAIIAIKRALNMFNPTFAILRTLDLFCAHRLDVRGCALDGGHHHASGHARFAMSDQSWGNSS